jgi:hypothetical protein
MPFRSKIAALPESIRDDLNRRLADGLPGRAILAWLNQLPEVRSVLAQRFRAQPLSHSNLTHWRKSGFRHWLDSRDSLKLIAELARESSQLVSANSSSIAQGALALASLKLTHAIRSQDPQGPADLERLTRALATVRAAEISEGRLQTERKKLQLWKREIDLLERRVKVLELNRLDPAAHPAAPNPAGGLSPETLERIRCEAHLL